MQPNRVGYMQATGPLFPVEIRRQTLFLSFLPWDLCHFG